MSELKSGQEARPRAWLLSSVSALTLVAFQPLSSVLAQASDKPSVWLEFGWHSDQVRDSENDLPLPLGALAQPANLGGPLTGGLSLSRSYGDEARATFRPDGTDWVFSASVNYGRAKSRKRGAIDVSEPVPTHTLVTFHTTIPTYPFPYHRTNTKPAKITADTLHAETISAEKHLILDFQVGRDVGLGLFGGKIESTVGIGVRVAQMKSTLTIANFRAVPDAHLTYFHSTFPTVAPFPSGARLVPWYHTGQSQVWHDISGNGDSSHSFVGIGPSIYWDASAPIWGDEDRSGKVSVDWGVNAALLYGRQKNTSSHQTVGTNNCYGRFLCDGLASIYRNTAETRNHKRVTVPNLGGYLGFSYRIEDFKATFGYRSDFFFGAIGTGLTGYRSITRGFDGPYASISIGLGG